MIPPVLRRLAKRPVGSTGVQAEKRIGKRLDARQTPASGAMQGAKGDIVLHGVLMEVKSTVKDSLSIKLDWLAKITGEARANDATPALAVLFTTGDGRPRRDGEWVMIPLPLWKDMEGDGS